MKFVKLIAIAVVAGLVSGCATVTPPLEGVQDVSATRAEQANATSGQNWRVADVRVHVPSTLKVSEANLYMPDADIVWREDHFGDRRQQVSEIIDMAVSQAVLPLQGQREVFLDVELHRFHALTQKARATVGGVHNIAFSVSIRDAETEAVLVDAFPVEIKLKAYGGSKAIKSEMQGQTQKSRITNEIAKVMRKYLRS